MSPTSAPVSSTLRQCFLTYILATLCMCGALSLESDNFSEFDWGLSKILAQSIDDNVILSPISVKFVLAMLYQGSRGNTSSQLESVLGLSRHERAMSTLQFSTILRTLQQDSPEYDLDIGTKMFVDKKTQLDSSFNHTLYKIFNASMEQVDFSKPELAVKAINKWAASVTKGHIQELISEADAKETVALLLLNAIYFKGQWQQPFPHNQTKRGAFRIGPNKFVEVQFMNCLQNQKFVHSYELESSIIRLPYMGEKFAMYLLLPIAVEGVNKLFERITPDLLRKAIEDMGELEVSVTLPKFQFDFASSMRSALEKLGLHDIFNGKADLSGITKDNTDNLQVSDVIQKAGILVNEQGSTAYVATQADLVSKFGEHVTNLIVDHPFIFFIEDERTNTIVFIGKVVNPGSSGTLVVDKKEPTTETPLVQPSYPGIHYQPDGLQESSAPPMSPSSSSNNLDNNRIVGGQKDKVTGPPRPINEETSNIDQSSFTSKRNQTQGYAPTEGGYFTLNGEYIKQNFDQERYSFLDTEIVLKLCALEEEKNFVVSPASIKTVLGMVYEGAAMQTEKELSSLLRLPKNKTRGLKMLHSIQREMHSAPGPQVNWIMANKLLVSAKLPTLPEYNQAMASKYHANVELSKFDSPAQTAASVNSWVKNVTRGIIPVLVSPEILSKDAQMILLNAVYFKGDWLNTFDKKFSQPQCFFTGPDDCKHVNMMTQRSFMKYGYYKQLLAHVVEIPYADPRYSMVIILPSVQGGLQDMLKDLPLCPIMPFLKELTSAEVQLSLPSFKVEFFTDLTGPLSELGAKSMFSDEADLRYMLSQNNGKISKIVHKAKIIVNEKGTEAGAGTAGVIVPLMNTQLVSLTVNHPFLFFIRDLKSGFIFAGRVHDPSAQ